MLDDHFPRFGIDPRAFSINAVLVSLLGSAVAFSAIVVAVVAAVS